MKKYRLFLISTFFLLSIFSGNILAQTTTVSDGLWNTATNWSNGVPGSSDTVNIMHNMILNTDITINSSGNFILSSGSIIDPAAGANYSFDIKNSSYMSVHGSVTMGGDLTLRNFAELLIKGCDTVRVGGDVEFRNDSKLTVESCAVLIIDGDLSLRNDNNTVIDGNIYVKGDLETRNNSTISGNGNLQVDGPVDIKNSSTIFGSTTPCNSGPCEYGSGAGLPIELLSFTAQYLNNNIIGVDWKTASEINNDFFTVEISTDAIHFHTAKIVKGAGNSTIENSYLCQISFEDNRLLYLRLKQTDYNGESKTFPTIVVNSNQQKSSQSIIYPNPGSGNILHLQLYRPKSGEHQLEIYNSTGNLLYKENLSVHTNNEYFDKEINIPKGLTKGSYFIHIISKQDNFTIKYLVK